MEKEKAIDRQASASSSGTLSDFVVHGGKFMKDYLKWVVMTYKALNTCEDEYFMIMTHGLNAKAPKLHHEAVEKTLIKVNAEIEVGMISMIAGETVAITADHWTSVSKENYLGVTGAFINKDWGKKMFV